MVFTLHLFRWLTFGLGNLSGNHPTSQKVASFGQFFFGVIKISSRLKAVTSKLRQFCFKVVPHFAREMQGNMLLVVGSVFQAVIKTIVESSITLIDFARTIERVLFILSSKLIVELLRERTTFAQSIGF